jgi:septal ring factor EnvC (AmiA/AmiB activator)
MRRRTILPFLAVLAFAAPCLAATQAGLTPAQADAGEAQALRGRLDQLTRAQTAAQARQGPDRARLEALNAQEEALRIEIDHNRGELGRLLSALQLYSKDPPPALLVSPSSANDAVRAAILMRAVTPELERRAQVLRARSDAYQRVRRAFVLAQASALDAESRSGERKAQIERLTAEDAGLEARERAAAAAPADRTQAENAAALGGLVAGVSNQEPVAAKLADPGHLDAPVQGERLSAASPSAGVTWRSGASAQVWAPASGRVEYAGPLRGWGQVVVISLGGDWRVVLAGLDRLAVRAGAQVSAGQGLGLMGAQGTPQLYMELRRGTEAVDPGRRLDAGPKA